MINIQGLYKLMQHFGADLSMNEDGELRIDLYGGNHYIVHIAAIDDSEVLDMILEDLKAQVGEN